MFFVTLFSMDFKSYSCYIPNCIFIGWLPFVHKFLFMILNLCTLGPIFSRLPSWSQFLYTFCIGLLYLFSFLNLQMNPFFHSYMNFIMSIFHIYFTIQEFMFSFRILLTTFFPILYTTIIPLCSLAVVIPIYGYLFYKRNKNIISFLTASENPLEEHEKPLFYDEHHFQNIFHVLPYLQLGVEHNLDYIIDFSLLHYLAARIRNKTVLVVVARIVAFFPPESNFLNLIIDAIGKFDNIRIIERFFIFHIKKIISMRHILDIDEINHNLYNLRKSSKDMIESIRGLWLEIIHSQGSISYTTFRYIYETSHQMKNQFVDTINKCSDSYEAINEYGTFLIEGLSDFTGSIDCEMKKRMIEKGQKIGVDYSFRSFVNIFPQYLTKEIIDRHGNFIYDEYMRQNLVTLATASSLITMKDSEYIEKSSSLIDDTISQGRLRISIQNSLKLMTFKSLKNYENLNIAQLVAIVVIFIFFVIFLPPENDDSIKLIDSFDLLSYSSIDLLLNAYYQSVRVAMEEDKISDEWHNHTLPMNNDDLSKVQSFSNNTNAIISIVEDTLNYYKLFVDSFTRNPKISKYCNFLLEPNFTLKFFEENKINKVIENLTFSQMLRYISSLSQRTASRSSSPLYPSSDLEITNNRLTVSFNSIYLGQVLEKLRQILIIAYDDIGGTQKTTNLAFGILMSAIATIIFLPLQIILICNLYSSVKETIKALQKVSPEIVEKSLLPIQLHQMPQPLAKGSWLLILQGGIAFVVLVILGILSVVIPATVLFIIPYINFITLKSRIDCFIWHYLSGSRLTSAAMGVATAYLNLVINSNHYDILVDIFNQTIFQLFESQSLLLMGSRRYSAIIGVDKELNEFLFLDTCNGSSEINSAFVDYVKCVSVDRAVNYLQYLFIKILDKFNTSIDEKYNSFLYDDYIDNLLLMDVRLIDSIKAYQVRIVQFVNDSFAKVDQLIIIVLVIAIVVSALIFVGIVFSALRSLKISFEGIKQMVRFLPPNQIISSHQLLTTLFAIDDKSFTVNGATKQSQAQAILEATSNGIVAVNLSGVIEMVNQSFINMTGYNNEQLVGQPFLTIFTNHPDQDIEFDHNSGMQKLKNSVELIQNGLLDKKESFVFHCQLENRNTLTSFVYIIGIDENDDYSDESDELDDIDDDNFDEINDNADNENNDINNEDFKELQRKNNKKDDHREFRKLSEFSSFLIVFRDVSEESKQKKKSLEIKKRSEILMKNILPLDVYNVVNEQKGPIFFTSNNATIIIAQITGINESVHTLLPRNLINMIGSYFDKFDEISHRYKAVHPIYTTEKLYVACCGLFDYEDNPAEQALQAVLFALEIEEQMKNINKEFETSFKINIEINMGGPLFGCVLDNQAPQFSLFGLIFDQALNLIYSEEASTLEISQTVRDLIANNKQFEIKSISEENKGFQFYQLYSVTKSVPQS